MKIFFSRQFLAFLCTGGFAAAVNFGSRIMYNQWMGFSAAVLLAYLTGMVTAFVLVKFFVFTNSRQAMHKSIFFFVLVNLLAIGQTWLISMLLEYYVLPKFDVQAFSKEIAHGIGIACPIFSSYLGHKRWSFK